jgi:hypothetical protein
MKTTLLSLFTLVAFAVGARADVKDGEKYKCGSKGTVTVSVSLNATVNTVDFSASQGGETSPEVTGTPGTSGGNTASDTPATSIPDGPTVRAKDGKMQYRNDDDEWIDCGRPRKRKNSAAQLGSQSGSLYLTAGSPAPHGGILQVPGQLMLIGKGDLAPHDGWLFRVTDDVTTAPL